MSDKTSVWDSIFSQYFTGLSKCSMLYQALTCLFFSNGVSHGEGSYRPWWLSPWLFGTIVPASSRSFWSSPQVILGSWTTLLIILFTQKSKIVRGRLMVKWRSKHGPHSAHWNILKFRNTSVTHAIRMFCNEKVARLWRELFAFALRERFLVWRHETTFLGHQLGLNQLMIIYKWNDWLISAGVLASQGFLRLPLFMGSVLFPWVISQDYT